MIKLGTKGSNGYYLYLYDDNTPILLPCLFARFTQVAGYKIKSESTVERETGKVTVRLEEIEIGAETGYLVCNRIGKFLEWVEDYQKIAGVSLDTHSALPDDALNEFINDYLIDESGKSLEAVNKYVDSLNSYYSFLTRFFNSKPRRIGIYPEYRAIARSNSSAKNGVKYLLPSSRELFYSNASSLLQEIVLRNGGELGCRTSENQGFLLNDFRAGNVKYDGILTLFSKLDKNPNQEGFEYHLSSLWTKYGRSRTLYIPSYLLKLMRKYYIQERPASDSDHLFISNSDQNRGEPISKSYGSRAMAKVRVIIQKKIEAMPSLYKSTQEIQPCHTYHVLRHSFGTDLFYNMCQGENKSFESITTESSIYIETARRMGHKVDHAHSSDVTKRYIHACGYRQTLEKGIVDGL